MAIKLDALLAGPALPVKEVYIDGLDDAVEFQLIPLERYQTLLDEVSEKHKAAQAIEDPEERKAALADVVSADHQMQLRIIAECLSDQEGMTIEAAEELCDKVRLKTSPAIFDEIAGKIMETILGKGRFSSGK